MSIEHNRFWALVGGKVPSMHSMIFEFFVGDSRFPATTETATAMA